MSTLASPLLTLDRKPTAEFEVGPVSFSALGDRLVIREDEFRSGYECAKCVGTGKLTCGNCNGEGKSRVNPLIRCNQCAGCGVGTCPECMGKGGTLIVPDDSQRRPTSGVIVSAGELCKTLREGDSVLYSNFAGNAISLNDGEKKVELRILHETEVLCRVRGHIELRTLTNKREMTTL